MIFGVAGMTLIFFLGSKLHFGVSVPCDFSRRVDRFTGFSLLCLSYFSGRDCSGKNWQPKVPAVCFLLSSFDGIIFFSSKSVNKESYNIQIWMRRRQSFAFYTNNRDRKKFMSFPQDYLSRKSLFFLSPNFHHRTGATKRFKIDGAQYL